MGGGGKTRFLGGAFDGARYLHATGYVGVTVVLCSSAGLHCEVVGPACSSLLSVCVCACDMTGQDGDTRVC